MKSIRFFTLAALSLFSFGAFAQGMNTLPLWASSEVRDAWAKGYKGQGTNITFVDEFDPSTSKVMVGRINGWLQAQTHGGWTSDVGKNIAPSAGITKHDFNSGPVWGSKPEPPKIPSADQRGLSRARSMG